MAVYFPPVKTSNGFEHVLAAQIRRGLPSAYIKRLYESSLSDALPDDLAELLNNLR